jgi:hypothetical protein
MSLGWTLHGDGSRISPGEVVSPGERLSWPRTVGIGLQHVVAMFGATFLVPVLTGFPPATTLFFSGLGTIAFLLITGNRLPSYLGSSFAFIAPITAATASGGPSVAVGGILAACCSRSWACLCTSPGHGGSTPSCRPSSRASSWRSSASTSRPSRGRTSSWPR